MRFALCFNLTQTWKHSSYNPNRHQFLVWFVVLSWKWIQMAQALCKYLIIQLDSLSPKSWGLLENKAQNCVVYTARNVWIVFSIFLQLDVYSWKEDFKSVTCYSKSNRWSLLRWHMKKSNGWWITADSDPEKWWSIRIHGHLLLLMDIKYDHE